MIRTLDEEREGTCVSLSSLSLPDWSLPSGESVTVLTELEVEIQQCRLWHVMEAPTLGPLYAHCNKRKKKKKHTLNCISHFILMRKTTSMQHFAIIAAFFDSIPARRAINNEATAFVARPAEIINRVFTDVRNYLA